MTIKIWGAYETPEAKILKEKIPLMNKIDEDYPNIPDDVDETNYDPYCGCDMFEICGSIDEEW